MSEQGIRTTKTKESSRGKNEKLTYGAHEELERAPLGEKFGTACHDTVSVSTHCTS